MEHIASEGSILRQLNNDFVVRTAYVFQSKKHTYFVMEYMNGGDLGSLIDKVAPLDEPFASFYLSEVLIAIAYLHSIGIIHRDLKPDNILIDATVSLPAHRQGHLKLTDFGLSLLGAQHRVRALARNRIEEEKKILLGASQSDSSSSKNAHKKVSTEAARIIGTPNYIAPEIIRGEEHTTAVDWWSFGVIAFEMLTGTYPFPGETELEVYQRILANDIDWPSRSAATPDGEAVELSPQAIDLIKRLLDDDPMKRLGSQGTEEVKNHAFFQGIDWATLHSAKTPFTPSVSNPTDTRYFAEDLRKRFSLKELIISLQNVSP